MTVEQVMEIITKYGPGAVFAIMWFLERQERLRLAGKLESLSERTIVFMTELKGLLTGKGTSA